MFPMFAFVCDAAGAESPERFLPCLEKRSLEMCLTQMGGQGAGREKSDLYAVFHNILSALVTFISYAHLRESSEASSATTLPILRSLFLYASEWSISSLASPGLLWLVSGKPQPWRLPKGWAARPYS